MKEWVLFCSFFVFFCFVFVFCICFLFCFDFFFWGGGGPWEMNRKAVQTICVSREEVLGRFVCSALRFIPHEPRQKDIHYLYLQYFNKKSIQTFCEKIHKFKFLLFTDMLTWLYVNHCVGDSDNWWTTLWLCSSGFESKIFAWFNERNIIQFI